MKSTTAKYFLDTNFFVYLFCDTEAEKEKRKKCYQLLLEAEGKVHFVVSTQVLKEFTAVMINKYKMDPLAVKSILDEISNFEVVETNTQLIKNAIDIHILNQLSFWDSLILSAAQSANCSMVLTEDMHDGQLINGIKIQSPFTLQSS